jgi:hypothetical protein
MRQRRALPSRLLNKAIEAIEQTARRDAMNNCYRISKNPQPSPRPADAVEGMLVTAYDRAWHSRQGSMAFEAGLPEEGCPCPNGDQMRTSWIMGYRSHIPEQ